MGAHGQIRTIRSSTPLMRRVGLMAVVLSGVLVVAAPAFAAPNEWRIVPSPNLGSAGSNLGGVSCLPLGRCVAVGNTATESLIEAGNGIAWSRVPAPPTPNNRSSTDLAGVSCISAKFCAAAGNEGVEGGSPDSSGDEALVDTWNGMTWSEGEAQTPQIRSPLKAVSCVSASFCVAVGSRVRALTTFASTLVEMWNGETWSRVESPNGPPAEGRIPFPASSVLSGVSCVSSTFCMAVGWYGKFLGYVEKPLIETWNGTEWSVVPSPVRETAGEDALKGVSCVNARQCVAVGAAGGTLAESWNGREWSILETPNPTGGERITLNGVSCIPWGSCAAVGSDTTANGSQTLVETSQGSKWSLARSANSAGGQGQLSGVSCVPFFFLLRSCVAVGSAAATPAGPPQALVQSSGIFF
jgi:hypothetical protein